MQEKTRMGGSFVFEYQVGEVVLHRDVNGEFVIDGYAENSLPHEYGKYYWIKKRNIVLGSIWESERMIVEGGTLYRSMPLDAFSQACLLQSEEFGKEEVMKTDTKFDGQPVPETKREEKFSIYKEQFNNWIRKGKALKRLGEVNNVAYNLIRMSLSDEQILNTNLPDSQLQELGMSWESHKLSGLFQQKSEPEVKLTLDQRERNDPDQFKDEKQTDEKNPDEQKEVITVVKNQKSIEETVTVRIFDSGDQEYASSQDRNKLESSERGMQNKDKMTFQETAKKE